MRLPCPDLKGVLRTKSFPNKLFAVGDKNKSFYFVLSSICRIFALLLYKI